MSLLKGFLLYQAVLTLSIYPISIIEPKSNSYINYHFPLTIKLSSAPHHGTFKMIFTSIGGSPKDPVPTHVVYFSNSLENTKTNTFIFDLLALLPSSKPSSVDSVYPIDSNLLIGSIYNITLEYVPLGISITESNTIKAQIENVHFVSSFEDDAAVLEELFVALDGTNWLNKWDASFDLCGERLNGINNAQFGLECNENGNVTKIELPSNKLKGKLPKSLGNLSFLEVLNLSDNEIEGNFPLGLMNLKNLKILKISANLLEGELGEEDFNEKLILLNYLEIFDISLNKFFGKFDSLFKSILSLENLKVFNIFGNQFSGNLNEEINTEKLKKSNIKELYLLGNGNFFDCPIKDYSNDLKISNDFDSTVSCNPRTEIIKNIVEIEVSSQNN